MNKPTHPTHHIATWTPCPFASAVAVGSVLIELRAYATPEYVGECAANIAKNPDAYELLAFGVALTRGGVTAPLGRSQYASRAAALVALHTAADTLRAVAALD